MPKVKLSASCEPSADALASKQSEPKTLTLDEAITIWEKAVETQMHFNEMSVKSRQLGLTFVAAALGVAIFLFTRDDTTLFVSKAIWGTDVKFHLAPLIVIAAAIAVVGVRILDLNVYHQMLRGAVAFGEDLEETQVRPALGLAKGMTQAVSHFSRFGDAAVATGADGKYVYSGNNRKSAQQKIGQFYNWVLVALGIAALVLFWLTN
jgi:hypothetical protein